MAMSFCPHIVIILSKERVAWIRRFWYIIGFSPYEQAVMLIPETIPLHQQRWCLLQTCQILEFTVQATTAVQDDQYLKYRTPLGQRR